MESNNIASNVFSWADVDWEALSRLRTLFLTFDRADASVEHRDLLGDRGSYWLSSSDLENYDFTFAQRIGWKWDNVLAELKLRGWSPPKGTVLDWGCGTGIAGRRVAEVWPEAIRAISFWDRSALAREFATQRAQSLHPNLIIRPAECNAPPDLLVVSHVMNELSTDSLKQLLELMERTQAVIWVEPGTPMASRKLIAVRESVLDRFNVVAPCTHTAACGMLAVDNERHWCHHFAKAPGFIHMDAGWAHFAARLNIDLGTLPFSFLVLDRRTRSEEMRGVSRVIGRPRHYKGFAKVLSCQADGVRELTCSRRDAPSLLKAMRKRPGSLYRWEREKEKIHDGIRLFSGRVEI